MPSEPATTTSDETAINTGTDESGESAVESQKAEQRSYSQADMDRMAARIRREEKLKQDKQLEQAQLSEAEKTKGELAATKAELRSLRAERQIFDAVKSAGADDPEVVTAWIQSKLQIDYDDDGKIANLKDLITESKERIPTRFPKRPGSGNGGDGNGTRSAPAGQSMNDAIRRAAGRL